MKSLTQKGDEKAIGEALKVNTLLTDVFLFS